MNTDAFVSPQLSHFPENGAVTWESPSNIALVKYWGKFKDQIPANPSISFTLNNCKTTTTLKFKKLAEPSENVNFEIFLEGIKKDSFVPKIQTFFKRILPYCPYLTHYQFTIETTNTFPHSSGIASSASGMSALALGIMSLERMTGDKVEDSYFSKKASFLARLGSGSACRSIEGPLVVWGEHSDIPESSNLYGIKLPFKVHENFSDFQDTILLIDTGEKQVSSTVGHDLLNKHPYAQARFQQANDNLSRLIVILKTGEIDQFIELVESEALSLHAMMLSSSPYFILMKPNTLEVINEIWKFRREKNIPVCFTLDAGANVHVLYPQKNKKEVLEFISNSLSSYCSNGHYICDEVGVGAEQLIMDNG